MEKINKILNFDIKQIGEESDRTLRFVGSDETPDRDNDIIEVTGWKLDNYLKNPVFQWSHGYGDPPIGKAVNVIIDAVSKKLIFDIKFATAEEYLFADTIYKLYKGGYLSATSVGFRGIKHKTRDEEEVLNMPEWQRGRRYMEQELLELSGCSVPSNPNALMMAKSAGIETEAVEKALIKKDIEIDNENQVIKVYQDEEVKAITFEFLKSLDDGFIKAYGKWKSGAMLGLRKTGDMSMVESDKCCRCGKEINPNDCWCVFSEINGEIRMVPICDECSSNDSKEQKSGATLSNKTKAMLDEIHTGLADCGNQLRQFIDTAGMMDEPPGDMPIMTAMRTAEIAETKQVLEEIKSQVLFLYQKFQPEAPKVIDLDAIDAKTLLPTDELNIEPSMLQKLISESVESTVKASVNDTIQNLKTGGINL